MSDGFQMAVYRLQVGDSLKLKLFKPGCREISGIGNLGVICCHGRYWIGAFSTPRLDQEYTVAA
jgi:hypothetical protein